jgi:beta-glucosidase
MTAGFEAQLKSLVLLKNRQNILPLKKDITLYIPKRFIPETRGWFGNVTPSTIQDPFNMELLKKYFKVTDNPANADAALVLVKSPEGGVGYDLADRKKGGNGYVPITLQYGAYNAGNARDKSIAAGDPVIDPSITDRSYVGKAITASNVTDLETIRDTKAVMKGKPVLVVVHAAGPMVFHEFEKDVDAILVSFGVQDQAIFEVLRGAEPSGLLPLQMPASMATVEQQQEDVPHDMEVHVDTEGHAYDFAFGLNWRGVISDERTRKYRRSDDLE